MSIPGAGNPLLLGGAGAYKIERSLRFNSADSASLSRTPASAGNRRTWTWAGWLKRSNVTSIEVLWSAGADGSNYELLYFSSGQLYFASISGGSVQTDLFGTPYYRDPSAWYHIILSADTTQAVANDRIKIYVNGSLMSSVLFAAPPLNYQYFTNNTGIHRIGGRSYDNTSGLNGYLVDVYLIDGQALTPSSFGETDIYGIWQPKAYSGSYGTNGFQLKFADNSAGTATTLGKDTSGNGNNWTPNNLSVTAGAGNDSLVDSPTNYGTDTGVGGEVRGNYATLNPLDNGGLSLANGNLDLTTSSSSDLTVRGTFAMTSGKWYWEVTATDLVVSSTGKRSTVGVSLLNTALPSFVGSNTSSWSYINHNGQKTTNNTPQAYGATWATGDVIGISFDADAGSLTFYKNGVSQGVAYSGLTSGSYAPAFNVTSAGAAESINFGQRPFAYAAPSGFKALCTTNLPTPTITKPSTVMDVKLYTGNGSTQTISGLGFSPDLVWIKNRTNATQWHVLTDSVRGVTKNLYSNDAAAEETYTDRLQSFDSAGFSLGPAGSGGVNTNTQPYVAWTWDAGSSTVTNTAGTISSQVRANASAGFSIVSYDLQATGSKTVGHGLGVAPSLIIAIPRSVVHNTFVYHSSVGATSFLYLNTTNAISTNSTVWDNTSPTSSVFTLGSGWTAGTYGAAQIAYCFAPVAGYSAFGSYTGNGSADGPFVFTGMRPRWVMIKKTNSATVSDWVIQDAGRDAYNQSSKRLYANLANAEDSGSNIDFLSNGFKIRVAGAVANLNESASTYIYACFAESPFALARAR